MDEHFAESIDMAETVEVDFGEVETEVMGHNDPGTSMEFETITSTPILMDTAAEEVVTDYNFPISSASGFAMEHNEGVEAAAVSNTAEQTVELSNASQIFDMQSFEGQTVVVQSTKSSNCLPFVTKPIGRPARQVAPAPRQVPIAPKPIPSVAPKPEAPELQFKITKFQVPGGKQIKKLTVSGALPAQPKQPTVLAQIGKQLVVVPAAQGQKFKIVQPASQAQSMTGKRLVTGTVGKQIMMKVPGANGNLDQKAVLTKIGTPNLTMQAPKIVNMQQKTVPMSSLANNMVITSVMNRQPQQVNANTTGNNIVVSNKGQGVMTKKVIITSNPAQSLIMKQNPQPKSVPKYVQPKTEGQQTQIHQIHVPGKGVQYIRLVTNSNATNNLNKQLTNKSQGDLPFTPRTTYLIDARGNVVPVGSKTDTTPSQSMGPPSIDINSLIVTSGTPAPQPTKMPITRKLVRIAPVAAKPGSTQQQQSSSKNRLDSLLAPMDVPQLKMEVQPSEPEPSHNTKAALKALIDEIVENPVLDDSTGTIEVEIPDNLSDGEVILQRHPIKREAAWEIEIAPPPPKQDGPTEHPLIVIPPDYYAITPRQERRAKLAKIEGDFDIELAKIQENVNYEYGDMDIEPLSPGQISDRELDLLKPRKPCNCTKSQCLKLYCDCFANGEFCNNCNCNNCNNNLENEESRQKAIRGCLERNPNAFRPKIGKTKATGPATIRRHNKGCNCKRSGCLKNYCECYEAKISCSAICKCVGCRNVDDRFDVARRREDRRDTALGLTMYHRPDEPLKQPCMFMTSEVIEAVCQCLLAAGGDEVSEDAADKPEVEEVDDDKDPMKCVIEEFSRCLQDIISASHQPPPTLEETNG